VTLEASTNLVNSLHPLTGITPSAAVSTTLSAHPGPEFPRTSGLGADLTDWSLMPQLPRQHGPVRYRLRVDGHLDAHWSARFDELALRSEDDGTTTLTGLVQDQSQLHGLLAKIRDLGLTLISMRVLDESQMDATTEEEDW